MGDREDRRSAVGEKRFEGIKVDAPQGIRGRDHEFDAVFVPEGQEVQRVADVGTARRDDA